MPKNKKKRLITNSRRLLIILIFLMFFMFTLFTVRELSINQSEAVENFSAENIQLLAKSSLVQNFVSTSTHESAQLFFSLTNLSEYNYDMSINGRVRDLEEQNSASLAQLSNPVTINLAKGTVKDVEISLSLPYFNSAVLELELISAISANPLINSETKSLYYSFPLSGKLYSDGEIVSLKATPQQLRVVYDASPVTLTTELFFKNNTNKPINEGFWQLDLLTVDGNLVQPLQLSQLPLAAETEVQEINQFIFSLPPANQIGPGKNNYKIGVSYFAEIAERQITTTYISSEVLEIEVVKI